MTFEELQDLLAEQFSCDTGELGRGVTLRVGRYGPYMEKADGTRPSAKRSTKAN